MVEAYIKLYFSYMHYTALCVLVTIFVAFRFIFGVFVKKPPLDFAFQGITARKRLIHALVNRVVRRARVRTRRLLANTHVRVVQRATKLTSKRRNVLVCVITSLLLSDTDRRK